MGILLTVNGLLRRASMGLDAQYNNGFMKMETGALL
jgi:hypothetical protein